MRRQTLFVSKSSSGRINSLIAVITKLTVVAVVTLITVMDSMKAIVMAILTIVWPLSILVTTQNAHMDHSATKYVYRAKKDVRLASLVFHSWEMRTCC